MFEFLLGAQPKPPPRVPTDLVAPVGFFNDTIIFRTFVMYTLFSFNDVLDPEKLRASLQRLVSRPGWNKLGGRLRRNERGELERHIPKVFSADRPAIGFDHIDLSDTAAEDHPVASRIPKPPRDGQPAVVGNPDDFWEFCEGPEIPKGLEDYVYTDRPELGLRVISFKNSTVVVLYWMHLSFDVLAKHALLNAWTLMLEGREDEILEPLAADDYPLDNVGQNPTEPHVLSEKHMTMPGLVVWGLKNAYNMAFRAKENRMVCIPAAFHAKLRQRALQDLAAEAAEAGNKEVPFLSEGDVISAWIARLVAANLPKNSKEMVSVQQVYEWRNTLTDLVPPNRPFISNCLGFLATLLTAEDLIQRPLSYVASQIRRTIKEQGTREQIEAYGSLVRLDAKNRAPPFFGESSMSMMMISNWTKGKLYTADLSAAAVKPRNSPLLPSYIQNIQGPYSFNEGMIIVGKDAEGNYWFSGYRAKGLWETMERQMKAGEA